MTKHKEFIGLLMMPDADKYGHQLARAAYRVVTNGDWDHSTIELGEPTYLPVVFACAASPYLVLRDLCFKKDGYKP